MSIQSNTEAGTVPANSYGTFSETVTGQPRSKLLDMAHHETVPFRTMESVPPMIRRLSRLVRPKGGCK